jgi:EmrB/QacA subfamily drug resistance transporter
VGRKRVFQIGLTVFVAGSALCAIAPDLGWLVVFRVLQAVGGSMLAPVAMAILSTTYPEPAAQARALGVWGGVTGLSLAVGPVAGGALVGSGLGWRWIFAINIPIGLIAVAVAALVVTETKAAKARRPDPVGQLLVMVLLVGLTYAVIEGGHAGWTTPAVITGFVVAVAALVGIAVYEPRRDDPMLELRFFRSVPFSGANVIAVASFAAVSSFLFLNSFYLQQGRGFSALQAGLLITPLALGSLIYGPVNGRILARWGARPCLVVAGITFTAGGLMLTGVGQSTPLWWLLIAYALFGLGNAAVSAPITRTAVAGMPRGQAGLAAGVSAATRQVGATIGVAIAGVTLGADTGALRGAGLATATHTGWWLAAGYGALTLVLAIVTTTRWAARSATAAAEPVGDVVPVRAG